MVADATITDQERAITFLKMLDDDVAEHTLRALPPEVSEPIRKALADPTAITGSHSRQKQVLDDFERYFRFAVNYADKPLKIHDPDGVDASGNPIRRGDGQQEIEPFISTGDSLQDLEIMNVLQVTTALEEEGPRTAALLMQELSSERNAGILSLMKDDLRDLVVRELSLSPSAPPILLLQMARTTVERAANLPQERPDDPDPVKRIAEVLRASDKKKRKAMLDTLKDQDEEMSIRILKLLYRFEDVIDLDDRKVRAVLGKVDTTTLSTALFGADEEILELVKSNLSKRARTTLEEELSFMSDVPESQLESAREAVGDAIAEVEQEAE